MDEDDAFLAHAASTAGGAMPTDADDDAFLAHAAATSLPARPSVGDMSLSFTPAPRTLPIQPPPASSIPEVRVPRTMLHPSVHLPEPQGVGEFAKGALRGADVLSNRLINDRSISNLPAGAAVSGIKAAAVPAGLMSMVADRPWSTLGGAVLGGALGGPPGALSGAMLANAGGGAVDAALERGVGAAAKETAEGALPVAPTLADAAHASSGPMDFIGEAWRRGAATDLAMSLPALAGLAHGGQAMAKSGMRALPRAAARAFGAGEEKLTTIKAQRATTAKLRDLTRGLEAADAARVAGELDTAPTVDPDGNMIRMPMLPEPGRGALLGPPSEAPVPNLPDARPLLPRSTPLPPRPVTPGRPLLAGVDASTLEPGRLEAPALDMPPLPDRQTPLPPAAAPYEPPNRSVLGGPPPAAEPPPPAAPPRTTEYEVNPGEAVKVGPLDRIKALGNELKTALGELDLERARETYRKGADVVDALARVEASRAAATHRTGVELADGLERTERGRMAGTRDKAGQLASSLGEVETARQSAFEGEPPVRPLFPEGPRPEPPAPPAPPAPEPAAPAPDAQPSAPPPPAPSAPAQSAGVPPLGPNTPNRDKAIPDMPPMEGFVEELEHPGRQMGLRDVAVSRATAPDSWLGMTDKQAAKVGVKMKPGSGGSGIAPMLTVRQGRATWLGRAIADRVIGDSGVTRGTPDAYAIAAVAENKATPAEAARVNSNPKLRGVVDRWIQLREEALKHPDVEVRGFQQNYVTHARDSRNPKSFIENLQDLERPTGDRSVDGDRRAQYLQVRRSGTNVTRPDIVNAAEAYGRTIAFDTQVRPGLQQVEAFLDRKTPEGHPLVDAADRQVVTDFVNDAYIGKQQIADTLTKRTPGVKHAVAALNTGLQRIGLPTIDNPLKASIDMAKRAADWTLVRPMAAALSHFIGDAWPKIAERGKAGVLEYAEGADQAMRKMDPKGWDEVEQLGVTERPTESTFNNPLLKGLDTAGKKIFGVATAVDRASKLGTFHTKLSEFVKAGVPYEEAKQMAALVTQATNYSPSAIQSIPAAAGRVGGTFYQFLKPGIAGADNLRRWVVQGDVGPLAVTGLGAAGLYVLGQATGTDVLKRVHLLPSRVSPAMFETKARLGAADLEDPFGVAPRKGHK